MYRTLLPLSFSRTQVIGHSRQMLDWVGSNKLYETSTDRDIGMSRFSGL